MNNDFFIITQNIEKFKTLCENLLSQGIGIDLAAVVGLPGRGKTTAALKFAAMNPEAIYLRYLEWLTHIGILREICFGLAGVRPRVTDECFRLIEDSLAERRRLIIIDEADRMNLRCINTLRALHDRCGCPVLFVGERSLGGKLAQERRISSRIRETIEFGPVNEADVVLFYEHALGVGVDFEQARKLLKHAEGDFRLVAKDCLRVEKFLKANGLKKLTSGLIKEICG